ncbi:MAG: glycosyltransferase family 2 protein [Phascolarctobacterium sp.]|nr:MAG: glycosyltransferase family 2 protein [Phascolarctobacterium sp.]
MAKYLTVVILTKNEEKTIKQVIENAQKCVADILVIDSGSTDKTVDIANACGAEVVFREWDNDFSAQRNFALQHVKTPWVLYLDADEFLDTELIDSIQTVLKRNENKQYSMMRKIHAFGFEYKHGIFKPDEVVRMFKTDSVHWENKVHERPICNSQKECLNGYIEHYTYENWQDWWEKAGKYTSIWAEDAYIKGKSTNISSAFFHAFYGFLRAYIIQLGFLDGWSGLYSSSFHATYILLKYSKLYELYKGKV